VRVHALLTRNVGRLIFGAALAFVFVGVLLIALITAVFEQQQEDCRGGGGGVVGGPPTAAARHAMPAWLLPLYRAAEQRYGVPWNVLAAINAVETDFGRNLAVSPAGAVGWMQFLPSTWAVYGVDGDDDGTKDPWNAADAIPAAARYLKASGSDGDLHDAIFAYNHDEGYVQNVLAHARLYAQGNFTAVADTALGTNKAMGYPLARHGPVIATPTDHQRRPLHNWQSDNAIDIAVPAGTPVLAVADATVVKTGASAPTRSTDVVGGLRVTLRTAHNEVFFTHMIRVLVRSGQRVRAGQRIGLSGSANNVEHLHLGLRHGDPLAIWGDAAAGAVPAATEGCASGVPTGPVELEKAVTVNQPRTYTNLPAWTMASGRAPEQVDTRILPDALWILRSYALRVTAAREAGHESHGDGTALDMIPAHGTDRATWDSSALRLAHHLGWTDSCAASGVVPACPLKPWVRFVGYNGYPNHGDPAHVGPHAHLHVSWASTDGGSDALVSPNAWVRVFPVPGTDAGDGDGVPVSAPTAPGAPSHTGMP
jgi:murein DD-endopeptidase MepM/ murein hydrolase activator NlpD